MTQSKNIGYLYVNGLNDGATKPHDTLARWWWQRRGVDLRHAHINWRDGQGLSSKLEQVEQQVQVMLTQFGGVAVIGTSAGGSLALATFHKLHEENICVIAAHARLKVGDYTDDQKVSLHKRAYMDTDKPSPAFVESVTYTETEVIPELSEIEKQRILTLSSVADMVVPPSLMTIDGVENHRSRTFGHAGGFLAHFIANRDVMITFAASKLL